jgi:ADP-ribose pyrophosphatase YjhB (NUDIX family)
MQLPVPVRRVIYRVGYRVLHVIWTIRRPTLRGVKCVLTDGQRVLLVRHTYGQRWWDLPGGALRTGELPGGAAHREMTEELGLTDVDWSPAGEIDVTIGRRSDHLYCFTGAPGTQTLRIDRGELAEARWFDREKLPAERSPHLVAILALALPDGA